MSLKLKPEWHQVLAKAMQRFGDRMEWGIEKSQKLAGKLRKKVAERTPNVKPLLALESQIPIRKLKEIIHTCTERFISEGDLSLVDQSVIEIGEGVGHFGTTLKERGAGLVVQVEIGVPSALYENEHPIGGLYTVRASMKSLPFENGYFDFILGNFATPYSGNMSHALHEISRLMAIGGRGIVIDFHPYGQFAEHGTGRLRGSEISFKTIQNYFSATKSAQLQIEDLKEVVVDESMRKLFTSSQEKSVFRSIKESPLLIGLYVKKVV